MRKAKELEKISLMPLHVELVSPGADRLLGRGEDGDRAAPSTGDIAFLPGHVPFIGVLQTHPVRVLQEDGNEQVIAVHQGFVEVSPPEADGTTRVTILSDVASWPRPSTSTGPRRPRTGPRTRSRADPDDEAAAALARAEVRLSVVDAA